jgi:hypothetical protein
MWHTSQISNGLVTVVRTHRLRQLLPVHGSMLVLRACIRPCWTVLVAIFKDGDDLTL